MAEMYAKNGAATRRHFSISTKTARVGVFIVHLPPPRPAGRELTRGNSTGLLFLSMDVLIVCDLIRSELRDTSLFTLCMV